MDDAWNFESLAREVMRNPDARRAAVENQLRRGLAVEFRKARKLQGLSIRAMAKEMGSSVSQVQRLLSADGGSPTLRTVVRAADVLGLSIGFVVSGTVEGKVKS